MRLVGRPRRLHVDKWIAGERRGEGERKVRHACACEVWIRMGTVERINVGEKGGKLEDPGSELDRYGRNLRSMDPMGLVWSEAWIR